MLLRGKVAVVSGLDPGIGRDIALALAREGADLVLSGKREPRMMVVADEIASCGRKALCLPADVSDADACEALATRVSDIFGRVDALVHNTVVPQEPVVVDDSWLDERRAVPDGPFAGVLRFTAALQPLLVRSGDGRVILVASTPADVEDPVTAVARSRRSAAAVTGALARRLGRHGIRVNGVHPGVLRGNDEPVVRAVDEHHVVDADADYDQLAEQSFLGYLPSSAEIADAVVFFASPLSRAVTGQALHVDAGQVPA